MSDVFRIERMVYGGSGVGIAADALEGGLGERMVPFVLPGELVAVASAGALRMEEVEVLEASAERVAPVCRHFGACGGCQYQHAAYGSQLAIKSGLLRDLLRGAGLVELPEIEVHAGEPWGYRNRIRLRVERVSGKVRVGYSSRGREDGGERGFIAIEECPISAAVLVRAGEVFARAVQRLAEELRAVWAERIAEVELFATGDEARVQMTVFVRGAPGARETAVWERQFGLLCDGLKGELPELVGVGLMALPLVRAGSRQAQRGRVMAGWGAAGLQYRVGEGAEEGAYWVSRGGFFQVNRFLLGELVRLATGGRRGTLAWDLYAGVGLFSRVLVESFEAVAAVESGEVAAADLASWARKAGVRPVRMTTLDFLRGAVLERERPELVVMDPPRAGVGLEVADLLGRFGAAEMVYVSCDPRTLARDLRAMVDSGYDLAELHVVDLFPQTSHMETVAVLRR